MAENNRSLYADWAERQRGGSARRPLPAVTQLGADLRREDMYERGRQAGEQRTLERERLQVAGRGQEAAQARSEVDARRANLTASMQAFGALAANPLTSQGNRKLYESQVASIAEELRTLNVATAPAPDADRLRQMQRMGISRQRAARLIELQRKQAEAVAGVQNERAAILQRQGFASPAEERLAYQKSRVSLDPARAGTAEAIGGTRESPVYRLARGVPGRGLTVQDYRANPEPSGAYPQLPPAPPTEAEMALVEPSRQIGPARGLLPPRDWGPPYDQKKAATVLADAIARQQATVDREQAQRKAATEPTEATPAGTELPRTPQEQAQATATAKGVVDHLTANIPKNGYADRVLGVGQVSERTLANLEELRKRLTGVGNNLKELTPAERDAAIAGLATHYPEIFGPKPQLAPQQEVVRPSYQAYRQAMWLKHVRAMRSSLGLDVSMIDKFLTARGQPGTDFAKYVPEILNG